MISTLLGAAACILARVTLARAAPAEPIRNIVHGGEARFRMVLVTKNGSGQTCDAEVNYCFHNENEKEKADE
jgi:hypothetical protein